MTRDSFLDQLNSVLVTFPVEGEDGIPLVVSGVANVFEANVSYEVLDADGNVVKDGFTMATCGTGCWGGYSFEVQYAFTGEETVRVFWHSAKDGSPTRRRHRSHPVERRRRLGPDERELTSHVIADHPGVISGPLEPNLGELSV